MKDLRLGVDVGGTFTDLVALGEGSILTAKVPSTPSDQSEGVMNAIEASEVEAGAVVALAHGMTVATNALLERRGARTALAHLVLGPWYHGQENGSASTLGPFEWGSDTGKWFRQHVMLPFLNQNLKNARGAAIALASR